MERPAYAPEGAVAVALDRPGISIRGELRHGDKVLALLTWNADGRLAWEKRLDAHGRAHGLEREFDDDGRVVWQMPWRHGLMHGISRMFAEDGRCISQSRFVEGVGVDVFVDETGGFEHREMAAGLRHGFERWGGADGLSSEGHYKSGLRHGIFRQWRGGRLEEGYPKYFVEDVEVTRAAYRARRTRGADLPPDLRREDSALRLPEYDRCLVRFFPRRRVRRT